MVADFEAGIGTLTRLGEGRVDVVLLVVESTAKSIGVAERASELVRDKSLGRLIIVANRCSQEADLATVRSTFPAAEVVVVPDDPAIVEADRFGVAPLDFAPNAPAVLALAALADSLLPVGA